MSERGGGGADAASAASLRLDIDLGALAGNWRRLRDMATGAECAAVVKADAYGIGIEHAVPALSAAGCRTFFVATPEEGRRARATAPEAVVYVLNGFFPDWTGAFRDADLRPVLNTRASLDAWAALCGAPSALHVDTGMNRLGLSRAEALALVGQPEALEAASVQLLISHLACADEPSNSLSADQLVRFEELRRLFPDLKASLANSAGIHLGRDFHFDLTRPGIALYGGAFMAGRPPLAVVATLSAQILQVRQGAAGQTVGYGATRRLARDTRIAIVSAGYADGYHRMAGSANGHIGGSLSAKGARASILGRVSMDLIAADVTDIPALAEGDWVELFGPNLPVDEAAATAGTVGYEFLTGLSRRAERRYIGTAG